MILINRIRKPSSKNGKSLANQYSSIDMNGEISRDDISINEYLRSKISIEIDYSYRTIEYYIDRYESVDFDEFITSINDLELQIIMFNLDRLNFI